MSRPQLACALVLTLQAIAALAQSPPATIRIEVTSGGAPVQDAGVSVNGTHARTGPDGVAALAIEPGHVDIVVSKDGFFPARKALDLDAGQEWQLQVELQPQITHEEDVRVYATRNDVRVQD